MRKKMDKVGQIFNRLTVIKRVENDKKGTYWLCQCECGNTTIVFNGNLVRGNTKSCGCLNKESSIKGSFKHGQYKTNVYTAWRNMKARCQRSSHPAYKDYGGRGIKICKSWEKFELFLKWVESSNYQVGLSLDRINNNRNYSPNNCKWSTCKEQMSNRRNTIVETREEYNRKLMEKRNECTP